MVGSRLGTEGDAGGDEGRKLAVKPFRVAYLVSHPIQYQVPLLKKLADHPDITLHVYYMEDQGGQRRLDPEFGVSFQWDIPLLEGYAWSCLRNRSPWATRDHFLRFIHPEIIAILRRERYDALIVHGYAHATEWMAFVGARASHTPLLLRGESTLLRKRSVWRSMVKRLLLGGLLRGITGALAIGTLNRAFYRSYGVPESRIFSVPYAVDNHRFQTEADRLRGSRSSLRAGLGWPHDIPVILYAGKLIPKKRPGDLLKAYARGLADHRAALVFLGDGSERKWLVRESRLRGLDQVFVTGFVNQTEIVRYYAAADLLVLPSGHEPWGLALNEGMCVGLPVIASDAVGAAPDLVRHGENGFVYPAGDIDALARALGILLADPNRRRQMGDRSREIVAAFSYEADLRGILEALHHVAREADAVPGTAGVTGSQGHRGVQ
jgi:glycosyltransferase involved in cell wall biosynthesis